MVGPTDVVTVLGQRGTGKSTLAWNFASLMPRLITFCRLGEHKKENYSHIVYNFDQFCETMLALEHSDRFRILYKFDVESDGHGDEFNEAMRIIYYRKHLARLIEEVWNFASKNHIPKWLKECYLTGRHNDICMITTSQRPASIHNDILAQTTQLFSGTQTNSNDILSLKEVLGREWAEKLKNLPKYEFIRFQSGIPPEFVNNKI